MLAGKTLVGGRRQLGLCSCADALSFGMVARRKRPVVRQVVIDCAGEVEMQVWCSRRRC